MIDTDPEAEIRKALDTLRDQRREIIRRANSGDFEFAALRTALSTIQEIQALIDVLKMALEDEKRCRVQASESMIA